MLDSDELLKLAVDATTGYAIIALDASGVVVSWNAGAERLLGYADREILGQDGDVIFVPEDRARGIPRAERLRAVASGRAEDERWHLRKDSSRFWGSGLLMALPNQQGFLKIMRDDTQRHRAEDLLKASEARFRTLATAIPQLVFTSRHDGRRTWGSPQWVIYTGLDEAHSPELGWLEAVHPDEREATIAQWQQATTTGNYDIQHRIRRARTDRYCWHQTRAKPLDPERPVDSEWVGTSTDIHELKALQNSQQILLGELQHRTRNLLSMVGSVARRSARSAIDLGQFVTDLEERLQALSRAQSVVPISRQAKVELRALIDVELAAHREHQRGADKVRVSGPRVSIPSDVAQLLALALHELATNAVKYGALRHEAAQLDISWQLRSAPHDEQLLDLTWRESGVPNMPALSTRRSGYGNELLTHALPYQLGATTSLETTAEGVVWRLAMPMSGAQSVETGR